MNFPLRKLCAAAMTLLVAAAAPLVRADDAAWPSKPIAIVAMSDVQDKLRTMGVEPDGRGPAPFVTFQRAEIAKWGKVIKDSGIQAE